MSDSVPEVLLLERRINYYPGRGRDGCIEYTSLINIRPAAGNRGMELQDPDLRQKVREITFALVGEGEAL